MIRFHLRLLITNKEFAEKRKISLDEIVSETGISKNTLSRMQTTIGYNAKTDSLNKLCRYFQCKISDIVEYVDE